MDTLIQSSRIKARTANLLPIALAYLDDRDVKGVSLDRTYYVCRYRNAWRSVRASHYFDGCFQTTHDAAREIAEQQREQGSQFCITEMPTLTVACDAVAVSVLEMNSENPLAGLSATPVSGNCLSTIGLPSTRASSLFDKGANGGDFLRAVLGDGEYWRQQPSKENSVFVHVYLTKRREYERLARMKPKVWRSRSVGTKFYLDWEEVNSSISTSALRNLVA